MTDPTGAPETGEPNTDPANPPTPETDETDWKAEAEKHKADVEKWKALSRKNEADLKAERDKAAKATMTADEKATAEAEAKGRKAAALDYGKKLAAAEFKAACATKQVDLGEALELINTDRFVDDAGEVDESAIKKAVGVLAKQFAAKPAAPGKSGGEFSGGSGAGQPITEEQMRAMSPAERVKALKEGKLAHLL